MSGRSTPKKITVIDDDDWTSSVTSLKNFHKHGRQRKNRNKIAPEDAIDLDRPSSAPTNNRTRQWLKEINENRPMTAAPNLTQQFVPPPTEKGLLLFVMLGCYFEFDFAAQNPNYLM